MLISLDLHFDIRMQEGTGTPNALRWSPGHPEVPRYRFLEAKYRGNEVLDEVESMPT